MESLRQEEMTRLVSQAELRALQSQINPHFLFNALNTLYGTILPEPLAARRMVLNLADIFRYFLRRLPDLYGSRFFDILLLDALYAQTPVLNLMREVGWDAVISLKQNARDLYQSAVRLFAQRPADAVVTEQQDHKTYQIQLWDTEGLPFTIDHPDPVRVVRSEEVLQRQRFRRGERTPHSTEHEWLWITTLPQSEFPPTVIRRLGHSRWKNENNGWMDLTKHWALKHGFLHACQHRPKQLDAASGQRQLVANHGLAAVVWILLIAFTLSSAFVLRHSKLARLYRLSTLAVAAQLQAWTSKAPPPIRAPD